MGRPSQCGSRGSLRRAGRHTLGTPDKTYRGRANSMKSPTSLRNFFRPFPGLVRIDVTQISIPFSIYSCLSDSFQFSIQTLNISPAPVPGAISESPTETKKLSSTLTFCLPVCDLLIPALFHFSSLADTRVRRDPPVRGRSKANGVCADGIIVASTSIR